VHAPAPETDAVFASYQIGVAKPSRAAFEFVLDRPEVRPDEAIVIDGKSANVAAATRCGLHAFQYTTVLRLREELAHLGIVL
jgi:HAD superfamily hydrolase (TIGR01509 family)